MRKEGLFLQHDMFTGQRVDNRSAYRKRQDKALGLPRQMGMFPLNETVQLGVQARPWLNNLPRSQMVLQSQDIRTDEEKERDLLREAEAQTTDLFADTYGAVAAIVDQESPSVVTDEATSQIEPSEKPQPSQSEACLELVQIVKEQATTLWIDEAYRQMFYSQLPIAILNAQAAGMTPSEITTAMQKSDASGQQEKSKQNGNLPIQKNIRQPQPMRVEGYRVRARRAKLRTKIRSRRVKIESSRPAIVEGVIGSKQKPPGQAPGSYTV